ncbi:MAG: iron-containing alcohol dehydrogenase [Oscillospiraceae bacterium]|jgi:alcohol dehydrogenase|nr:iron-containing alcohol dehydrogenase [Oscillospiraceae bacterium]
MAWEFHQPTRILFGAGEAKRLAQLLEEYQIRRPALVCGKSQRKTWIAEALNDCWAGVFSDIQPNPTTQNARECAAFLRESRADGVVALGGGSVLDCAKVAAEVLPLLALPTTAGTGSEVTNIAVLTGEGGKQPAAKPEYYPLVALVDPALTFTCPPQVTAESGMDALAHALEAMWSKQHTDLCDALACKAAQLIFTGIEAAYQNGAALSARAAMSEGALLAGMAFSQTKTAAVHACSFPLTQRYGLSHGAACAFTLAAFARINADARLHKLAKLLGFADFFALAVEIERLQKALELPQTLIDAGIPAAELPLLSAESLRFANMQNNPAAMDEAKLLAMFRALA